MDFVKQQTEIIKTFESKMPKSGLSREKCHVVIELLWEAVHDVNMKACKDLLKEIEELKFK